MDKIAGRRDGWDRANRQIRRKNLISEVEAMARVGRVPTQEEYVTYHCYNFVAGNTPLPYEAWVASLGVSHGTGMDGGVP